MLCIRHSRPIFVIGNHQSPPPCGGIARRVVVIGVIIIITPSWTRKHTHDERWHNRPKARARAIVVAWFVNEIFRPHFRVCVCAWVCDVYMRELCVRCINIWTVGICISYNGQEQETQNYSDDLQDRIQWNSNGYAHHGLNDNCKCQQTIFLVKHKYHIPDDIQNPA